MNVLCASWKISGMMHFCEFNLQNIPKAHERAHFVLILKNEKEEKSFHRIYECLTLHMVPAAEDYPATPLPSFFRFSSSSLSNGGNARVSWKIAAIFTYTTSCIFYFILIGKPIRPSRTSHTPLPLSPRCTSTHFLSNTFFFHHHKIRPPFSLLLLRKK